MSSPYARSKQQLEASGYFVGRTEHWNSFVKIRQDLFGIIDMVCVKANETGVLGVQPTVGDRASDHLKKALANKVLPVWLAAGNRFVIHAWRKVGDRGKRKLWECREVPVTIQMYETNEKENVCLNKPNLQASVSGPNLVSAPLTS